MAEQCRTCRAQEPNAAFQFGGGLGCTLPASCAVRLFTGLGDEMLVAWNV
ncbi:hypothetical protein LZC95_25585 [Pendulispora brunnea]|uniref:Uncharacterized protein n=1 Tax=Pendulispora brunnea TaxID=2905690 RepID=A0ABZ2KNC4_9BACT